MTNGAGPAKETLDAIRGRKAYRRLRPFHRMAGTRTGGVYEG